MISLLFFCILSLPQQSGTAALDDPEDDQAGSCTPARRFDGHCFSYSLTHSVDGSPCCCSRSIRSFHLAAVVGEHESFFAIARAESPGCSLSTSLTCSSMAFSAPSLCPLLRFARVASRSMTCPVSTCPPSCRALDTWTLDTRPPCCCPPSTRCERLKRRSCSASSISRNLDTVLCSLSKASRKASTSRCFTLNCARTPSASASTVFRRLRKLLTSLCPLLACCLRLDTSRCPLCTCPAKVFTCPVRVSTSCCFSDNWTRKLDTVRCSLSSCRRTLDTSRCPCCTCASNSAMRSRVLW